MRHRRLPLTERLAKMPDDKSRRALVTALATELFHCEGMQMLAQILQDVEREASALVNGENGPHFRGVCRGIDEVRRRLSALLPDDSQPDWEDEVEEEFMPPLSYGGGFDVPIETRADGEPT